MLISCGFEPVYQSKNQQVQLLAKIQVETVPGRIGQKLKINLEDTLNPMGETADHLYRLAATPEKVIVPSSIEKDGSITRYTMHIRIPYQLFSLPEQQLVDQGSVRLSASYDAIGARFSTYIAEEDIETRLLKELSEDLRVRLIRRVVNR